MKPQSTSCPDCHVVDRRDFLKAAAGAAAIGAVASSFGILPGAFAAPSPTSAAETAVGRFYTTLSAEQKKTICFGFADPLRQKERTRSSLCSLSSQKLSVSGSMRR